MVARNQIRKRLEVMLKKHEYSVKCKFDQKRDNLRQQKRDAVGMVLSGIGTKDKCSSNLYRIKVGDAVIEAQIYEAQVKSPEKTAINKKIDAIDDEIDIAFEPIQKEYNQLQNFVSYKKMDDELLERIEKFFTMFDEK